MRGILRLAALMILALNVASTPAAGQARTNAPEANYAALLDGAQALTAIEPTTPERRDLMRATAVTLAERLKHFTLVETEERADEKVAPPPAASLRPGEEAPNISLEPGAPEAIETVPDSWFARHVTDSRSKLKTLIQALDSGEARAADLMFQAEGVLQSLRDLVRPPDDETG